jgi:hypothetical protein
LHGFFASCLLALVIGHVYLRVVLRKNWSIGDPMLTGTVDYDHYAKFHILANEIVMGEKADVQRVES